MDLAFLDKISEYNSYSNRELLEDAAKYVSNCYDRHDADLNQILGELKLLLPLRPDDDTIIALLFHEAVLNKWVDISYVQEKFGNAPAELISNVQKILSLDNLRSRKNSQVEVFRKFFLTIAKDVRGIFILFVKRLYLLKNLGNGFDPEKSRIIAQETLDIYVPIASRLGIYRLKTKLEDNSFKYLNPEAYAKLNFQLNNFDQLNRVNIERISEDIHQELMDHGVSSKVYGRIKSVYSSYRKMEKKHFDSPQFLYDMLAFRVILPTVYKENGEEDTDGLYHVLGLIHTKWKPLTHRFKDFIVVPKTNGYQSLHTVVTGLIQGSDQPVEIQIRSKRMHKNAEFGVSAHWLYKQNDVRDLQVLSYVEWLKGLEQFYEDVLSSNEVVKVMDIDIFKDRIFVLTPGGDVKDLPQGATPVDFAYMIHTDVGNRCVMAKVDGQIVPLDYKLHNGEVVEIITHPNSEPKLQWFSFVVSDVAKRRIHSWFNRLNKDLYLKEGRKKMNDVLAEKGYPLLDQNLSILKNISGRLYSLPQRERILIEIGKNEQSPRDVIRKIYPLSEKSTRKQEAVNISEVPAQVGTEDEILVGGHSDLPLKIASCCNPTSDSFIIGYVTRGNRITIHSMDCFLLDTLDNDRVVFAQWRAHRDFLQNEVANFSASLEVVIGKGVFKELVRIFKNLDASIMDFNLKKKNMGVSDGTLEVKLHLKDIKKTHQMVDQLNSIPGVVRVSAKV